jgi:hypothetical protein
MPRRLAVTACLVPLVLLAAGCGASSPAGGVAIGTSTAAPGAGAGGGAAPQTSAQTLARLDQYSQCMRENGVPSFPDPTDVGGHVAIRLHGLPPDAAAFRAAQQACQRYAPPQPTAAQMTAMQSQALRTSACMRAHGVPDFPDPTFSGGGVQIRITPAVDPNSPTFKEAQSQCQSNGLGIP